jgi:G3E family GTPase
MKLSAALPVLVKMRPMVMITGFLGAGKTSFLRDLLEHLPSQHLSADVILNDYENAELDAETIQGKADSIAPLSASCACCGGFDDLIKLCLTVQETRSDVLIIELNGTADPIPLLEIFTLLENKLRVRPRWQIAIIDASQFGLRGEFNELELEQLQTASHFVLTHTDRVSERYRYHVLRRIKDFNPHASRITAARISTHLARTVADATPAIFRMETGAFPRPRTHSQAHHLSHSFTGCQLLLPSLVRSCEISTFLEALPSTVVRAKALVTTPDNPDCRQLFERVGLDFLPNPIDVPISEKVPPSAICIGPKLDPQELLQLAIKHIGPNVTLLQDD